MLLPTLILSATFLGSMLILMKMTKGEEKPSPTNNNIDIHIHNSFDGQNKTVEDSVIESKVMQELDKMRDELKKEQQLDLKVSQELDKLNKHLSKSRIIKK